MFRALALLVLVSVVTADANADYYASRAKKVGEFTPPSPPAREVKHLANVAGSKIPAPTDAKILADIDAFLEVGEGGGADPPKPAAKPAAAAADGGAASTSRVPHNWFGTGKFVAPQYSVATGAEECSVCKAMISQKRTIGTVQESNNKANGLAEEFGCGTAMNKRFDAMCRGYMNYLNDCPAFIHNICHEDVGGSEKLRAPCPDHLTCYYCLRINPLHCIDVETDKFQFY